MQEAMPGDAIRRVALQDALKACEGKVMPEQMCETLADGTYNLGVGYCIRAIRVLIKEIQ